jgi:hypothetical protein
MRVLLHRQLLCLQQRLLACGSHSLRLIVTDHGGLTVLLHLQVEHVRDVLMNDVGEYMESVGEANCEGN